ncbi:MAG: VOC family protein [Sphingomonadales bacterium]|nr:MAG: VOC family protein [Sphingomonadales bacterium]
MSNLFPFGQPVKGIVQMAYTVENIHAAMDAWSTQYGVGPFFLNEGYVGENSVFRGQPDTTSFDVAMGFSGGMMIELIEVKTPAPSIYHEGIERSGYGFHHVGIVATDFDADLARYRDQGFDLVVSGNIPETPFRYAYLENPGMFPGYLELIPPQVVAVMMTPIYRASVGWSGKNPVRPMK